MFWNDAWEYHGEHFDFPLRNVIPKPRQKPHPPLWVACSQLETIRMAGRRGMGALGFQFVSAEAAQAWVHAYYNAFTSDLELLCDHATNPNIAVVSQFMCAPTDEEARARAEGSSFFQFALGYYATHPPGVPGEIRLWEEYLAFRDTPAGQKQRVGGLIGSPDTIRERLRRFEESNVDQVILLNQAGKNTHEDICSSLELFATEVMPEFHDREPRAPGVEAGGAGRRDRARGARHRALRHAAARSLAEARRPNSSASSSRSTRRRSLPVSLNGSSSVSLIRSGVHADRSAPRTWSRSSASSTCGAGLQHDRRHHPLAPLDVGDADDGGRLDGRVLDEHGLDLAGREVLAAADDHVVEPPVHEQVALVVEAAAVAGVEPAVVGAAIDAEVLARHLLAAHPDLAELAVGHRVALGIADRELDARAAPDRPSRGARAPRGSSLAKAARWSSGPRTATVLDVSVRP